ncbi:Cystathionine beta-lyase [Roseomonas mucosa]|uniref:Cystathionine beta-lyase n=1 Tax=Roseomonas mucosa TaxID=207340 RepID=A0A4Y1N0V5_9PROT|nr:cystathionine beta-lyase [Roseomonas mucosa]AWV23519.1 Cystathionine beta-lyase [Roseomonas mucosa]MDT8277095.1 cystathionine beta-lyase [Roseomonas mucosa]MDT8353188.1 cystathionine beta-lyase [Roseomonas mucosa]MDU7524203.1 cystathionine beta-lyase [Roseomonas mucosa]
MPDTLPRPPASRPELSFETRMTQAGRAPLRRHGFVNPPVQRGSTVLHASCEAMDAVHRRSFEQVLTYGTAGGPTHHALEDAIAEVEGGTRCLIVGTGLAAIAVPLLAYLKAGDHCLIADSIYGPTRRLADGLIRGWGIEVEYYDPLVDEAGMEALLRPNTRVVMTESPGSHTFEVQDIPAIVRAAHRHGAKVLMDNTWGIHHFQPFEHGVDVSIQALTKYVGGHSDILLGSVTVNTPEDWQTVRNAYVALGQFASPDDCWLALRGLRTLPVRLKHQAENGLEVARWLEGRPEVARVLHPALPSHPQHAIWKRDFTGTCSLFGVVLQPRYSREEMCALVDGLHHFGIGASWGGYESLALPTAVTRTATPLALGGQAFRLHIGLEDPADLIADLARGLDALPR